MDYPSPKKETSFGHTLEYTDKINLKSSVIFQDNAAINIDIVISTNSRYNRRIWKYFKIVQLERRILREVLGIVHSVQIAQH